MPGELSTVGAGIALDAASGRATQTARSMYLALLTAAPADATTPATMTELSATGYARVAVTWTAPAGDPASTQNSGTLTFGPFSTDPANVPYCALVSSSSGTTGDLTMFWTLTAAKDAAIGESIQFAAGALVMTLD
jgi:hypothetical protein